MKEYEDLGHMIIARQPGKYYIPHHVMVKRIGPTIKLRVVFDASAKSSTGISLNDLRDDGSVKILGLHWDPVHDLFSYHVPNILDNCTKRKVLSTIAQLYVPLGALAPVIFWAKCFMQRLWQSGISWDDPLSPAMLGD